MARWNAGRYGAEALAGTHYRAHGVIGQGGMAVVLDAEDVRDRRRVVVKVLLPDAAQSSDLAARLRIEAAALQQLRHPNLVRVEDWGVAPGGQAYMVMERLHGRDLRAELKERGALPRDLAVELARQALAGLEVLHARGIVHRDVKPANLFLCAHPDGGSVLKLLDLGIAKVTAEARLEALSTRLKTAPGEVLGTPKYVAPENLLGRSVTAAADVYAMGLVLYEMLTGRHPFAQRNLAQMWHAHLTEMPPPPCELTPEPLPGALDRVVMRALAKEPKDRFADATEMAAALARAATALAAREPAGEARHWAPAEAAAPTVRDTAMTGRGAVEPAAEARAPETQATRAPGAPAPALQRGAAVQPPADLSPTVVSSSPAAAATLASHAASPAASTALAPTFASPAAPTAPGAPAWRATTGAPAATLASPGATAPPGSPAVAAATMPSAPWPHAGPLAAAPLVTAFAAEPYPPALHAGPAPAGAAAEVIRPSGAYRSRLAVCLVFACAGFIWHAFLAAREAIGLADPKALYGSVVVAGKGAALAAFLIPVDFARDVGLVALALGLAVAAGRRLSGTQPQARWGWMVAAGWIAIALLLDAITVQSRTALIELSNATPGKAGQLGTDAANAVGFATALVSALIHAALVASVFRRPSSER